MEQTSVPLSPLQHQQRLGKLVIPLLFIVNSGLDAIGETQLAEISQRHIQTCRVQLRRLASLGYLERCARYHGYVLKRQALEVIPTRILDQAGLCLGNDRDFRDREARQGSANFAAAQGSPSAPGSANFAAPEPSRGISAGDTASHPIPNRGKPADAENNRGFSAESPSINRENSALAGLEREISSRASLKDSGDSDDDGDRLLNINYIYKNLSPSSIPTPDSCTMAIERAPAGTRNCAAGNLSGSPNAPPSSPEHSRAHSPPGHEPPGEEPQGEESLDAEPQGIDAGPEWEDADSDSGAEADADNDEEDYPPRTAEEIQEARELLRSLGIFEPTRSRLLALEWIIPEYITAWRQSLNKFPGPGKWNTGLLVMRLREEDWPPDVHCLDDPYRSYSEGEYADFIEP